MPQVGQKPPTPWVVPSLALPGHMGSAGRRPVVRHCKGANQHKEAGVQVGQQPGAWLSFAQNR